MSEQLKRRNAQQKTNGVLWGIFGLLLVLVALVIFVLPGYLSREPAKIAAAPAATAPAAATASTTVSATAPALGLPPFEEAQRLRQREVAQNTLAALLELQATLEQKQVASWAGDSYNAALAQAKSADELYATQQFAKANELYQSALTALQKISDSQSGVFGEAMKAATAAYAAGSAVTAEAAYRKAQLLQPDSLDAATGLKRSLVLTQVTKLMNDGRTKQAAQQLEAARDAYQQAATLDGAYTAAVNAVREMNTAIADRNFSAAMSKGYAALQAGQYEQALAGFRQAQTLRPNANEISAAIQQVNDKQTFASVNVPANRNVRERRHNSGGQPASPVAPCLGS
jgi:tetratricopeptide (TPR) repeat protein